MSDHYRELDLDTMPGSAPGEVRIDFADNSPSRDFTVVAGQVGTWKVTFTAGKGGIAVGGGVALWWPHGGLRFSRRSQAIFAQRRGYVTLQTSGRARVELHVNSRDPGHTHTLACAIVRDRALAEGDQVVFRFNDRSAGAPGEMVCPNVTAMSLDAGVDVARTGVFCEMADSPLTISVAADNRPARYLALAPTSPRAGAGCSVKIVALDARGNLAPATAADLDLRGPGSTELPDRCLLSPLDGGRRTLEGVAFEPGVHCIEVLDRQRDLGCVSNPIYCESDPEYQVFWGDLHNHCYDDSL